MKNLGYSQNFLVNKKLVERLISKSNIDVTDYVIEIGPGKGIITDVLSQHAGEVVAVEYDQELYNNLLKLPTPMWCVEPWKFNISANKKGINLFRLV